MTRLESRQDRSLGAGVQPETRYLWLGQSRIAYQVIGQGPPDLVVTNGSMTHVDIMWDDPAIALMCRRFASFSRLIRFDRLERQLSVAVIDAKPRFRRLQAGRTLVEQGERDEELFLLFDGVLQVEIDGKPVTQVGPGAILGEMALLSEGRRMATLRAVTPCRVAVVPNDRIDRKAMEEIAKGRMPSPGH